MNLKPANRIIPFLVCSLVVILVTVYHLNNVYGLLDSRILSISGINNDKDQLCTFALFREFMNTHGYFPGGGRWLKDRDGITIYQLDFCVFKFSRIQKSYLSSCLTKSNVTSIVTMGDSTGARRSTALRELVGKCRTLGREGKGSMPDKSYFKAENKSDSLWEKFVTIHYRYCFTCVSGRFLCQIGQNSKTLTVEHLALTMTMDNSIRLHHPKRIEKNTKTIWALTTQEFLLRYYLKNRYPDILLVFLPFHHDKKRQKHTLPAEMQYFNSLVDVYVPKRTKVIYLPTSSEFQPKRTKSGKLFNFHRSASEMIDDLNHMLYRVLSPNILKSGDRTFGFMDMVNISKNKGDMCLDGVHMIPEWYRIEMSMFLQVFCNSVLNDAF